jgi:cell division protein FtsB
MRRAARTLVVSVVLVGILFLFVFPTRTYLTQRKGLDSARARVTVLSKENEALAARVKKLNTDAEIERLAREQYSLVRPGEEAYAILPAPQPLPTDPPPDGAKAKPKSHHRGFLANVADRLTFWS